MTSRFECASASLSLRSLLARVRRAIWAGLAVSVAAHLSLTTWRGLAQERSVAKPLTTQFVKRQPRLTKPLELKKRPKPRRRQLQRKMVAVKAKLERGRSRARFQPTQALGGLTKPAVDIGRVPGFAAVRAEPRTFAKTVEGTKEARQKIDMSLELFDVDALDTGRYHALVIQDPEDKRGLKGFLHLATAYPARWIGSHPLAWAAVMRALVEAMNRFTDIRTDSWGRLTFDSAEFLKLPFLYTEIWWVFRLNSNEANRLGNYLVRGGFLLAETIPPGGPWYDAYDDVKVMIRDALRTQGLEEGGGGWRLERLPESHPVYHCYFDFDGPPVATDLQRGRYLSIDYLEGVMFQGRALAILSRKFYVSPWVDWTGGASSAGHRDNTRQLQFGVNFIVFALTQQGSITHRLMDSIR